MGWFQAAQRELERQRKEEWERQQRGELQKKKKQEQDDIVKLKAKKKSLELELEAVVGYQGTFRGACQPHRSQIAVIVSQGTKHRQISDRLRDFQNKKKFHKTELELTSQRIDARQRDIINLQKELEVGVDWS